ncbi:MAG: hypothetical protein ABIC96_03550 [Patescibacteria group bacterium]
MGLPVERLGDAGRVAMKIVGAAGRLAIEPLYEPKTPELRMEIDEFSREFNVGMHDPQVAKGAKQTPTEQ